MRYVTAVVLRVFSYRNTYGSSPTMEFLTSGIVARAFGNKIFAGDLYCYLKIFCALGLIAATMAVLPATKCFAAPARPPVEFFGAQAYGSAQGPYFGLKKGDFDADGNVDFVTTSTHNNFVVFGDSSGAFGLPISIYNFSGGNYFPAVGDFNEDGRSDIAIPYRFFGVRGLAVYLGRADRTFAPPITSHLSDDPQPTYMQVVDYDLDGNLDIIAGAESYDGNSLVFCKGNGDGTFTQGDRVTTTRGISPYIADFNSDGLPDVLYSQTTYGHLIFINPGNSRFGSPTSVALPGDEYAVGVKDVNADGHPDIIMTEEHYPHRWVSVWLGSGPTSYTVSHEAEFERSESVWFGEAADLDMDGKPDLVFNSKNTILIKKGNGNGTFAEPVEIYEGGNGFFLEDMNHDGVPDMVASQSNEFAVTGSGNVVKLINLGSLRFSSAPSVPVTSEVTDIATGNLNFDDLKDIVVVSDEGEIQIFLQIAGREYARQPQDAARPAAGSPLLHIRAAVVVDVNADGKNDILSVGRAVVSGGYNCLLLKSQGDGSYTQSRFSVGPIDLNDLVVSDVNADGKPDLIAVGVEGAWLSTGNGNGTFGTPVVIDQGVGSMGISAADLNGDQRPDLAVLNYSTNKVAIYLNDGSGTFAFSSHLTMPLGVSGIAVANMNYDSYPDILVSNGYGVSVALNYGSGVFNTPVNYPISQMSASGIASADYNLDGHPDVAVMAGRNSMVVLLNNGNGGLSNETIWGGGVETTALVASDLNNDSKPDLLLGSTTSSRGRIKLYFNIGEPQAGGQETEFDYDGDGRADLSVRRPSDNVWHLLRATAGYTAMQFGETGDRMTPADYDGDGKTDVSVFRPANGTWHMFMSQSQTFQAFGWGQNGDLPVPTDRDNDGKTDLVIFRPSNNTWYTRFANGTFAETVFGVAGDKPLVGDFDADGKGDIAVYRPSNNNWYILKSSLGFFIQTWGEAGDTPVTGDFDGDGATDQAVFRPSTGEWYLSQTTAGFAVKTWGVATDIPVAADYDGDGKADAAVFRPSEGNWYILNSTAGIQVQQFGEGGDVPTQSSFNY